jgi:SET family sugar efflux transporter-like MFS transporter
VRAWTRVFYEPRGPVLAAAIFTEGIVAAIVVATMPLVLSQVVHFDKRQIALYFVLYSLVGTFLNLLAGQLSDGQMARNRVTAAAGITSTLAYLVLSLSTYPPLVYLAGAFASTSLVLFSQLFAVARTHLVARWPLEEQTIGMTTLRTVFTLGYVVGTLLASILVGVLPLQSILYLVTVGLFLLAMFAARAIYSVERRNPAAPPGSAALPDKARPTAPPASSVLLFVSLAALFLLQGADSTRNVYLPLVEFQVFGDASVAPLMFAISAAVELVTTTVVGYIATRIGETRTISLGALVGAAYFGVLSLSRSLTVLYAANVLYAVFVAALMGVAMSFVFRLLPDRAGISGALYLATFSGGTLFGAVSPLVVTGYSPSVFLVSVVLCVAGSVLILAANARRRVAPAATLDS